MKKSYLGMKISEILGKNAAVNKFYRPLISDKHFSHVFETNKKISKKRKTA